MPRTSPAGPRIPHAGTQGQITVPCGAAGTDEVSGTEPESRLPDGTAAEPTVTRQTKRDRRHRKHAIPRKSPRLVCPAGV